MDDRSKTNASVLDHLRANFRAGAGTPSLYAGYAIIVLLFAYSGAFHTQEIGPFPARLKFFGLLFVILIISFHVFSTLIALITGRIVIGDVRLEIIASLFVAIVGTLVNDPIVILVTDLDSGILAPWHIFLNFAVGAPLIVVASSYHIRVMEKLFRRKAEGNGEGGVRPVKPAAEAASGAAADAFAIARNAPLYLEADDHTVKLVFADHVVLKRTKLSEAARQWASSGMRVHKSFWVNASQIQSRERSGRQLVLVLKSGHRIPVGRSFEKLVTSLDI